MAQYICYGTLARLCSSNFHLEPDDAGSPTVIGYEASSVGVLIRIIATGESGEGEEEIAQLTYLVLLVHALMRGL